MARPRASSYAGQPRSPLVANDTHAARMPAEMAPAAAEGGLPMSDAGCTRDGAAAVSHGHGTMGR